MENGNDGNLADRFSGLALDDGGGGGATGSDGLFQVMKAVEAAEATIKQQVEENNRLRSELEKKYRELERYRSNELGIQQSDSFDSKEHFYGPDEIQQSLLYRGKLEERVKDMPNASVVDSPLVLQHDPQVGHGNTSMLDHAENHSSSSNINGTLKVLTGGPVPVDSAGLSQLSSPSNTTFSSRRNLMDGDYDARGHVLTHMAEMNNPSSIWKQDYSVKVREYEEEIMQLRKYLADFSTKETQIRNEKYVLEKRIAYMRAAFDQQQQDLVDAASKALSYRQDIIEENVRLTYELQAAQQERSTFISSLVPLLAEYSLQPPVPDAQSIVSKIRILFRHLQEQLNHTEFKVKEFQYQLGPWHPGVNPSNFSMHSPFHPDAALMTPNKNGLHLVVPQATYSSAKVPVSSVDGKTTTDWDQFGDHQSGLAGAVSRNPEQDDVGRYSPLASRGGLVLDSSNQLATTNDAHAALHGEDIPNRQVMYHNAVSNSDMDDLEDEVNRSEREPSSTWGSGNSPYLVPMNDPSSSHSYLEPVLEEPSSSFSEAADDDPLPAIKGLQISGEAFPGRELKACGYSIDGTTSCNFEWVRHLEDGSVNYIDGAKQPTYLVTADDVDTYLAIEVQPLDDRKRKGELVKVFANEHRKITCDPEMRRDIEKTLYTGHASYKVSLSTGYLDIWEPATFSIKREGYSIKCSGAGGVVVTDKFLPNTNVSIPYGQATQFIISTSNGTHHLLRADNSMDDSCSRDAIVLTFKLFIIRAGEKRKAKKRNFFF